MESGNVYLEEMPAFGRAGAVRTRPSWGDFEGMEVGQVGKVLRGVHVLGILPILLMYPLLFGFSCTSSLSLPRLPQARPAHYHAMLPHSIPPVKPDVR